MGKNGSEKLNPRHEAITLRQLRALDAVAQARSITGAAQALGLTAPAVHSQLRVLEDAVGAALVFRDGAHAFQPTPAGEALLLGARRADAALRAALGDIEALQQGRAGRVVLAVVSTAKYFVPALVAELGRSLPGIEISLRVGNRDWVVAALRDGTVDMAITGRPPREPRVTAADIGPHPHVLIAPPAHPLAALPEVPAQAILAEPLILREPGSGTRLLAQRFLDRLGEGQSYAAIEMDSNETIKQAVMAGLGIALISAHTVSDELNAGRLVALRRHDLPIIRRWFLLHREDMPPTGAAGIVWQDILSREGRFLPAV